MRASIVLSLLFGLLLASAPAQDAGGIVVIRGSSRRAQQEAPPPAEGEQQPAADAADAAPAAQPDAQAQPAPEAKPRSESSQRFVVDSSGRRRAVGASGQVTRGEGSESLALKVRNLNGREVPYLNDTTKVVRESGGVKVSERVKQRFGPNGESAGQEMERIEERKLPDGTVETIVTSYAQDLNGRMQPAGRKVIREKESNGVTRTLATTEQASMNGGFHAVIQEETVERKQGDELSTIEKTVKTAAPGSPLAVSAREETTMRKQGAEKVTETLRFERAGPSSDLEQTSRTVGTLVEQPDGTATEKVETFGFGVPGGPVDVNASRMALQKVVESRTTIGSDGSVQERTTTRERSVANPSEFASPVVSRKVSKPLPDGESVRTDTFEPGVNGRLQAVESVIEKIEK